MKSHYLYALFDCKVEIYEPPLVQRNKGEALRNFGVLLNDPEKKSKYSAHPSDFTLFELASYDESSGAISLHAAPLCLGNGLEFISNSKLFKNMVTSDKDILNKVG